MKIYTALPLMPHLISHLAEYGPKTNVQPAYQSSYSAFTRYLDLSGFGPVHTVSTGIRTFRVSDYSAIAEIRKLVYHEDALSEEEIRFEDLTRDTRYRSKRLVYESSGRILGVAEYYQPSRWYHPKKFEIALEVTPDHQGHGVGTALYLHLCRALREVEPVVIRANIREDRLESIRFFEARGFEADMRQWESWLDVTEFDIAPLANIRRSLERQGIVIKTLHELSGDREIYSRLYNLERELVQDIPFPEPQSPVSYDFFLKNVIFNPRLKWNAYWVALDGNAPVGTVSLLVRPETGTLYTRLTGVRRDYRRRGIAMALKLLTIQHAQTTGCPVITTKNRSINKSMIRLNERLGFKKKPAWLSFALHLSNA